MSDEQQQVRWGRVALISLFGIAVVGLPFLLARLDAKYGTIASVTTSTLTNIGTSIVLVGVVFFLERGFVKRVTAAAAESTARVVEERTAELQSANDELATALAGLRAEFHDVAESAAKEQTAPLRNVATDVSFDSVAQALETANDLGALRGGVVTVPLKAPVDRPELVTFDWSNHEIRGPGGGRSGEYAPAVRVSYHASRNPGGGPGFPVVEVLWLPHETPSDLLLKLRQEMTRCGFGAEAKDVDADLLEHVGCALNDAVAGRTATDGSWVRGQLSAWLADGWAVTDEGLVTRDHGTIPRSEFPKTTVGVRHAQPFEPPVPEGVSETFWRFAVGRAHSLHGRGNPSAGAGFYGTTDPALLPFSSATSPRVQKI